MWNCLSCSKKELNLQVVLDCGQSFRWKKSDFSGDTWIGVLTGKIWILKQTENGDIMYMTVNKIGSSNSEDDEKTLIDYFQLKVSVAELYEKWKDNDSNFKNLPLKFIGIRILRQDPVENLFSFICSQNNNIARITQLVEKLCVKYGKFLASFQGQKYYSFPEICTLAHTNVEFELRKLGFGYRAKFIQKTAAIIMQKPGGPDWLYNMRSAPYKQTHQGKLFYT